MISLDKLQKLFYQTIFEQGSGSAAQQALSAYVNDSPLLSSSECIDIYRSSVIGTFVIVLGEIYPVTRRLLGDEFFTAMSKVYIQDSASGSPDLCDYGASFPEFLTEFEHTSAMDYLADVARFEWIWHRVFNAVDMPAFDFDKLAAVPDDSKSGLIFQLAPETGLFRSEYPVLRIWEANQQEADDNSEINLDAGGVQLGIWREQLDIHIEPLNDQQWFIANACRKRLKFWDLCLQFDQQFPGVDPGEIIGIFLANGLICSFK